MDASRVKKTGYWLIGIGLFLMLTLGLTFGYWINEKTLMRGLHSSLTRLDGKMERLIEKGMNYESFNQAQMGLVVFENDSLTYWNTNEFNPKLLRRKVSSATDTICALGSGDYYIKSFTQGSYQYYVFKLISTHYQIENQYFENTCTLFPRWVHAEVRFQAQGEGAQLVSKPEIRKPFRLLFLPLALLVLVGLLMVLFKPRQPNEARKNRTMSIGLVTIFLISMVATVVYSKVSVRRENDRIRSLAERLSDKRDNRFEKSYTGFVELVKTDSDFHELVFAESNVLAEVVLDYSKELLFDENMKAYDVTLTLCDPGEEISVQPEGYIMDCEDLFLEKIANNKHARVGDGLYFMDYYTLDPNYIGKIPVYSPDSLLKKTLYFEFYKSVIPHGFGFPQLLQENSSQKPYDYSVAHYRDSLLVYKYGRYVYPNSIHNMRVADHEFQYGKRYKHYAVRYGENDTLVISMIRKQWSELIAPFALFFLGLSLPFLFVVWLFRPMKYRTWKNRSFRQRLQIVIFLVMGFSFLIVGAVSMVYMRSLYNQNARATQFSNTRTLSIEMSNDLDLVRLMKNASGDQWNKILQQYANTFFTDLNLYRLNGQLLASTRPEIYDLELQAAMMNGEAYQNMHRDKAIFFTHQEQLGNGVYESSYIPLTDSRGLPLAYLNTPYFSSTTDFQKEIKGFVLTYLNIILFFVGITLLIVLLLTKQLTKPLLLLQSKIAEFQLNHKNELIDMEGEDEIGSLVKEYNKLSKKLEISANELMRTTTESAWRGVAREVAHEITNTLTPMSLSLQSLQRAAQQKKGDVEEHLQRTTTTLLEQIQSLSDIASTFSRYAKMPINPPQPLNLAELVGNLVNLYDMEENVTFSYDYDPEADYTFNGDKTNLNSAIGNILKNAVQAIGTRSDGQVRVSLESQEQQFVIRIKDNGKGIKEENKKLIFLPNFTTKSSGSGIGLSLAYNIIQTAGGKITFESQEGVGTEFIVTLSK